MDSKGTDPGNSLAVQCSGLGAVTARAQGSIQAQGTKVLQAVPCSHIKKRCERTDPELSEPRASQRWLVSMMRRNALGKGCALTIKAARKAMFMTTLSSRPPQALPPLAAPRKL